MIDRKKFEDIMTSAASEYSYEASDTDFECVVKVTCEDGWAKATLISQEEGGENG